MSRFISWNIKTETTEISKSYGIQYAGIDKTILQHAGGVSSGQNDETQNRGKNIFRRVKKFGREKIIKYY